jgi:hypothetical protein
LERYMGVVGAKVHMPLEEPWRVGKRPYGRSALSIAASCLKGFYLHHASLGVNVEVGEKFDGTRLPSRVDRRRSFLGHVKSAMPANLRAPKGPHRRHPKMLPDGAREKLLQSVNSARYRMVVTWLADGGLRIGELCGLHLVDLHLRENVACNECRSPHLHVCHRPGDGHGRLHGFTSGSNRPSGMTYQLTADNRTLDERLKAARFNLRFQDRRVADLEAQIVIPGPTP